MLNEYIIAEVSGIDHSHLQNCVQCRELCKALGFSRGSVLEFVELIQKQITQAYEEPPTWKALDQVTWGEEFRSWANQHHDWFGYGREEVGAK